MKKLLIPIFILFFAGTCHASIIDTVKVPSAQPLTDSTALLSIKDVNQLLQFLSAQEMKPSVFLLFKNGLDQLIQTRIKEFQKPKNK